MLWWVVTKILKILADKFGTQKQRLIVSIAHTMYILYVLDLELINAEWWGAGVDSFLFEGYVLVG